MKLRNKKTWEIKDGVEISIWIDGEATHKFASLTDLNEEYEDAKEPLIKDDKICKMVQEWAEYNQTKSVEVYNLVYDHGGVCIANALVRFYDPRLRTNIDVWFKTKAPTFEQVREYTITELCGEKEQ